ncbi:MAG: glutathione S-transferase [Glaciecola sp.]|jgi:glutathione S-transferase|uniref:glutathione S-transferase N-terminal domain-containing protein n=1 Tax=Congregibacter sp. TaxID=2744308 RepID=UPI0039E67C37
MLSSDLFPLSLYGSSISYFTGKLEMYFRVRGIPYVLKPRTEGAVANEIMAQLGSTQMPAVQLADGRWMSDSTVIIQSLEQEFPQGGLYPDNALLFF